MEHYCSRLQAGLHSHSHPWMNLNNKIFHKAYLEFTDIFYGLQDQKLVVSKKPIAEEILYHDCESVALNIISQY
jgi:hypothetical protein